MKGRIHSLFEVSVIPGVSLDFPKGFFHYPEIKASEVRFVCLFVFGRGPPVGSQFPTPRARCSVEKN